MAKTKFSDAGTDRSLWGERGTAVSDLAPKGDSQGESPPDGEVVGEVWRVKIKQQVERSDVASLG